MNKFLTIICLSMLASPVLFAADEKAAPPARARTKSTQQTPAPDAKNKPSEESSGIAVKNKSSFEVEAGTRNPFWPIGFKPKARIGGAGDSEGAVPASAFLVSTITLDTATRFAIINGKTMFEGQQFGLQIGAQIYQVTVKRIEDGRVILGRHDEEIVVPLRRK
jgi:hypothetical protein